MDEDYGRDVGRKWAWLASKLWMAPDVRDRCTAARFLSKGARTKEEKGLMGTGSLVPFNPAARPVVNVATQCQSLNLSGSALCGSRVRDDVIEALRASPIGSPIFSLPQPSTRIADILGGFIATRRCRAHLGTILEVSIRGTRCQHKQWHTQLTYLAPSGSNLLSRPHRCLLERLQGGRTYHSHILLYLMRGLLLAEEPEAQGRAPTGPPQLRRYTQSILIGRYHDPCSNRRERQVVQGNPET